MSRESFLGDQPWDEVREGLKLCSRMFGEDT
jgi:hypothetical protein